MDRNQGVGRARGKVLAGHAGHSGLPLGGWASVLLGLPFLGAGIAIHLGTQGPDPALKPAAGVPPFILQSAGWIFGLLGLYVTGNGLAAVRMLSHQRVLAAQNPHEPWLADWQGSTTLVRDDTWARVRRSFFGATIVVLMISVLTWFAWWSDESSGMIQAFAVVGDLLAAWCTGYSLLMVLRALRFGAGQAHLKSFPFFLGEEVCLSLRLGCNVRRLDQLTLTLRSVDEVFETRGVGRNRSTRLVCYETWNEVQHHANPASLSSLGGILEVRFLLPKDAQPTHLCARPGHFWELAVQAQRQGLDLKSSFLLPVYARAGTGPAKPSPDSPRLAPQTLSPVPQAAR